jgi:hypothetical protein
MHMLSFLLIASRPTGHCPLAIAFLRYSGVLDIRDVFVVLINLKFCHRAKLCVANEKGRKRLLALLEALKQSKYERRLKGQITHLADASHRTGPFCSLLGSQSWDNRPYLSPTACTQHNSTRQKYLRMGRQTSLKQLGI